MNGGVKMRVKRIKLRKSGFLELNFIWHKCFAHKHKFVTTCMYRFLYFIVLIYKPEEVS